MAPPRILLLVTKRSVGGAAMLYVQLARQLRDWGHPVETWFLYREHDAFIGEPAAHDILDRPPAGWADYIRLFRRLRRELRRFRPDAVIGALPLANVVGSAAAASVGVRNRVATHHYPLDTIGRAKGLVERWAGQFGLYRHIVAVSQAAADSFAGMPRSYRRRLRVIENGVAVAAPTQPRADTRRRLGLPEGALVLGTVGRLAEQKNHALILDIMDRIDPAVVAIVGTGPLESALTARSAAAPWRDRLHWLGTLEPAHVPEFLGAIDAFILPSLYEGMPLVVIEALQLGVPILASDIPSTRETVTLPDESLAARLVALDDQDGWVAAIANLADPETRASLAAKSRQAAERFSLPQMAQRYLALLD